MQMEIIPVEITKAILSWLPDYHLILNQRVSILWNLIGKEIVKERAIKSKKSWVLADLVKRNDQVIVKLFNNLPAKLKNKVCAFYAYLGNKEMINYCLGNGAEWTDKAVGYLIHGGRIELMKWAKKNLFLNPEIWKIAAYSGRLDVLNTIPEGICPRSVVINAVLGNHLDVVAWAVERNFYYYYNVCEVAAKNKYFDILEWFVKRDVYLSNVARFYAVHYGGYQVLEQIGDTEQDHISLQLAASYGNLEILQKAAANGKRILSRDISMAATNGHFEIVNWGYKNGFLIDNKWCEPSYHAALGNRLDILIWLKENHFKITNDVCTYAAQNNNLEMMKWAIDNGCQISIEACNRASDNGHFEMVKWIVNNGPWSVQVFRGIARHGNMEMLIWLNEIIDQKISIPIDYQPKYYAWGRKVVANAVEYGNMEMIKWLLNHGYSYDKTACESAAGGGQLEILKWLVERGCPCYIPKRHRKSPHIDDRNIITRAARNGHLSVFKWLIENLFPSINWRIEYTILYAKESVCRMDGKKMLSFKTNYNVVQWYQKYILDSLKKD